MNSSSGGSCFRLRGLTQPDARPLKACYACLSTWTLLLRHHVLHCMLRAALNCSRAQMRLKLFYQTRWHICPWARLGSQSLGTKAEKLGPDSC